MYSAGILPYTYINDEIFTLLGRESYDGSYSDFGGKFEYKDLNILHTACREFQEESLFYDFDILEFTQINTMYVESRTLKGNIYYMFLVHMDISTINQIQQSFNAKIQNAHRLNFEKDQLKLVALNDLLQHTLTKYHTVPTSYKLRHVFYNTINMHRAFFNSFPFLDPTFMLIAHHRPVTNSPKGIAKGATAVDSSSNSPEGVEGWILAKARHKVRPQSTSQNTAIRQKGK